MRRWLTVLLCPLLTAVALGHCHRGAPYHNPDNGRFWTMDSFEGFGSDPASLHKYTYCGNNAVNAWDPSGHSSYTYAETSIASGISLQTRLTYGTMWGLLGGSLEGIRSHLDGGSYFAELCASSSAKWISWWPRGKTRRRGQRALQLAGPPVVRQTATARFTFMGLICSRSRSVFK